jgi:hypothetical protein
MVDAGQHEQIIEKWMLATVGDGGIERFDDLHIDQIDKRWADRRLWVDGALESFQAAARVLGRHSYELTLSAAFTLRDGRKRVGVNFRTLESFGGRLDWMPPSLYLFRKGQEP